LLLENYILGRKVVQLSKVKIKQLLLKFPKRRKKKPDENLKEKMTTPQPVPVNSVQGIESLILFALQVFTQVFPLFVHPTSPLPTSAAPALIAHLNSTPGATSDHKIVVESAVNTAAAFSKAA
jgi:hypothetical protein